MTPETQGERGKEALTVPGDHDDGSGETAQPDVDADRVVSTGGDDGSRRASDERRRPPLGIQEIEEIEEIEDDAPGG
jgi:hypothetical protein